MTWIWLAVRRSDSRRRLVPVVGLDTLKYPTRPARLRVYLKANQGVSRRNRNSTPRIGNSLVGICRVGSRRGLGRSSEGSFESSLLKRSARGFQEGSDTSGVRSDVPSSGPSRALSYVARSGRRSATSPRTSSLRSDVTSLARSFLMSSHRSSELRVYIFQFTVTGGLQKAGRNL